MTFTLSALYQHFFIALIFLPLIAGISALVFFTKFIERITARVSPNEPKQAPKRPPMPQGKAAWIRYLGERVLAIIVFVGLFTSTLPIACVLLVAATVAIGYILYQSRITSLRVAGATNAEAMKLTVLLILCLVCFDWFVYPAIAAFYRAHT